MGAKRLGGKRPGGDVLGAKRLGGEMVLGRNDPDSLGPIFGQLLPDVSSTRTYLFFFLPLRLKPRGGRQTGIPVYQVLKGVTS